jgi:hypothetical protein
MPVTLMRLTRVPSRGPTTHRPKTGCSSDTDGSPLAIRRARNWAHYAFPIRMRSSFLGLTAVLYQTSVKRSRTDGPGLSDMNRIRHDAVPWLAFT